MYVNFATHEKISGLSYFQIIMIAYLLYCAKTKGKYYVQLKLHVLSYLDVNEIDFYSSKHVFDKND